MKALAKSRTRLLARCGGSVFGATEMVLRCPHPFPGPFPPHTPQQWKHGPTGARPAARGRGDRFFLLWGMESVAKTRGNSGHYHCMPRGCKDTPPTGCPSKSTGCHVSSTGCVDFSTGLFSRLHISLSLYLFLFIKEREKERGLYSETGNPRV